MLSKILVVLIGCPLGLLIIIYRKQIVQNTGKIATAEQYLGAGGTYTLWVIIGVAVFAGSLMWATGYLQDILQNTLGRFT